MDLHDAKRIGKFLTYVLRHKPEAIGLHVDENGWADIEDVVSLSAIQGYCFTIPELHEVVRLDDNYRFVFSKDRRCIRATRGHSIAVATETSATEPPSLLYHGTTEYCVATIRLEGLQSMNRQYVHLHEEIEHAAETGGRRRGQTVVFKVLAKVLWRQRQHPFYRASPGVWLTPSVPPQYLKET